MNVAVVFIFLLYTVFHFFAAKIIRISPCGINKGLLVLKSKVMCMQELWAQMQQQISRFIAA